MLERLLRPSYEERMAIFNATSWPGFGGSPGFLGGSSGTGIPQRR
jgi:hypothetical protein